MPCGGCSGVCGVGLAVAGAALATAVLASLAPILAFLVSPRESNALAGFFGLLTAGG